MAGRVRHRPDRSSASPSPARRRGAASRRKRQRRRNAADPPSPVGPRPWPAATPPSTEMPKPKNKQNKSSHCWLDSKSRFIFLRTASRASSLRRASSMDAVRICRFERTTVAGCSPTGRSTRSSCFRVFLRNFPRFTRKYEWEMDTVE